MWIFGGLALAFLVKTPVWPLHTWMPDTYADLPPRGRGRRQRRAVESRALRIHRRSAGGCSAGQMAAVAPLMFVLGSIGLVYGALVALVEDDAKRIVAYSSLSHLGLDPDRDLQFRQRVALGGAIVYIVAHGLFSAGCSSRSARSKCAKRRVRSRASAGSARATRGSPAAMLIARARGARSSGPCRVRGRAADHYRASTRAGYVWPALIALVADRARRGLYAAALPGHHARARSIADLPQRADLSLSRRSARSRRWSSRSSARRESRPRCRRRRRTSSSRAPA